MNTQFYPYFNRLNNRSICWHDVVRMLGERNYTTFVLKNGKTYTSAKPLCYYEPHLPEHLVRIHKGSIINLKYIDYVNFNSLTIVLTDKIEVKIARRRWKQIRSILIN